MKKIGIVSYNIYGNFTNYGSALQSWALHRVIEKMGFKPVLVDYCPEVLAEADPLNPFKKMWDKDPESIHMCELAMPAIRENYYKFSKFYENQFNRTESKYTSINFNEIQNEDIHSFVCGSDTIFCPDEFGIDDGYYANYDVMKGNSIAYAASFGDPHFTEKTLPILNERLKNFNGFGLREQLMVPYVLEHVNVPVEKVIDPTLLLKTDEYNSLTYNKKMIEEKYLLLYSRRFNPIMEQYAEKMAKKNGWKIVDISLRATNVEKGHIMFYQAGVEEFLSLVRDAEFVVTNSYHGMIFSVQFMKDFVVFLREQCNTKITELLELFNLSDRALTTGNELFEEIDYKLVHENISKAREHALKYFEMELTLL